MSIRARYGKPNTGARGAVQKWRSNRSPTAPNDLRVLASCEGTELASIINNHQVLSGGSTKAEALVEAAARLSAAGVNHAADLDPDNAEHRQAYMGVRGLGPVTLAYFCMLVGHEDVKADTWVVRVVDRAIGTPTSSDSAHELLMASAKQLNVKPRVLDHAVWDFARSGGLKG